VSSEASPLKPQQQQQQTSRSIASAYRKQKSNAAGDLQSQLPPLPPTTASITNNNNNNNNPKTKANSDEEIGIEHNPISPTHQTFTTTCLNQQSLLKRTLSNSLLDLNSNKICKPN
jgi:hypothetical protein